MIFTKLLISIRVFNFEGFGNLEEHVNDNIYYFLKITVSRHHSVPCNQCIFYCHGVPEERNCILLSRLLRVPGGEGWRKWGRERGRVGVEEEFVGLHSKLPDAVGRADLEN